MEECDSPAAARAGECAGPQITVAYIVEPHGSVRCRPANECRAAGPRGPLARAGCARPRRRHAIASASRARGALLPLRRPPDRPLPRLGGGPCRPREAEVCPRVWRPQEQRLRRAAASRRRTRIRSLGPGGLDGVQGSPPRRRRLQHAAGAAAERGTARATRGAAASRAFRMETAAGRCQRPRPGSACSTSQCARRSRRHSGEDDRCGAVSCRRRPSSQDLARRKLDRSGEGTRQPPRDGREPPGACHQASGFVNLFMKPL